MSWENSVQILDLLLGSLLIGKLWRSGLYKNYHTFWLFLIVDILGSYGWLISRADPQHLDYRVVWLCTSIPVWVLTLSMVYRHMEKILTNLPGIAKLSRTVLNIVCAAAIACGALLTYIKYANRGDWNFERLLGYLSAFGIILAGTCAAIALVVFLAMLTFLIWFPVSVPKNVASLTAGLLLYFMAKTVLLVAQTSWSRESLRLISFCITIVSAVCFTFWVILITPEGENSVSKLHLPWRNIDKEKLIRQLELMDQSLAHVARR
jgi:hypothetical protein